MYLNCVVIFKLGRMFLFNAITINYRITCISHDILVAEKLRSWLFNNTNSLPHSLPQSSSRMEMLSLFYLVNVVVTLLWHHHIHFFLLVKQCPGYAGLGC